MNTNSTLELGAPPASNSLPQRAREVAHHTREAVQETYQHVRANAEQGLARSEAYVRENPVPSILGALAIGTLLGFAIGISRREEPSFRARLADDPLHVIRDAVLAALTPAAERLHDQYDSARESAAKAIDKAHRRASRSTESWLNHLGRASSNLKFW
ncbi:MAG: hypothetical protein U0984_13590 [Prosthecobacter sp.]|nr:hypothetical protein [Prosthecobacter sp.]